MNELLLHLDSVELSYWLAFSSLEPLDKSDIQTALVCTTVANCAGAKSKLDDFILDFTPPRASTQEEIIAWFKSQAKG